MASNVFGNGTAAARPPRFTIGKCSSYAFLSACILSFALIPLVGEDFFPHVDSGEFNFHMRAPTGTRIEDTAALCDHVENDIRSQIPPNELVTIIDNIGLPYSSINLSYSNSAPIGTGDADILVELAPKHHPTEEYVRALRVKLNRDFPGVQLYDLPTDMVSQYSELRLAGSD